MPIIYLFFPETKGMELEDVDQIFDQDHGLEKLEEEKTRVQDVVHVA